MSPAVEKILAEINTLTPAEQRELRGLLGQDQTSTSRPTAQLVNEIKGKYSFVATSSEAFAARK
jgi:DNA-directed RNA polymerase subunit F